MWTQPKAKRRVLRVFHLCQGVWFQLLQFAFTFPYLHCGIDLFIFDVLRTCSPNTRDSAGFAGSSLRVCAVTRVGWVGWDLAWVAAFLRNFLGRISYNKFWKRLLQKFCVVDFLENILLTNFANLQ